MKTVLLLVALLLVLISESKSDPVHKPPDDYSGFAELLSSETLYNLAVTVHPDRNHVVVSVDGKVDLYIQTAEPIPRKLSTSDVLSIEQQHLLYKGKRSTEQYLRSQTGKGFRLRIITITPLAVAPRVPAQPKASVSPGAI